VVDHGSTDDTAEMAGAKGVTVLVRTRQARPGAARNESALQAKGKILFFVEADVLVTEGTVALNLDFYRFLFHKRGLSFVVLTFFMHMLYYFYSGLTFVLYWSLYRLSTRKRTRS
jgi:hypothetical protein